MRILIHSNAPWAATGYGVQTRIFAPRIAALGHHVAVSAFYGLEGAPIKWDGLTVYPKAFHPYGMDIISSHVKEEKADVVITLVDAWVLDHQRITSTGAKWCPWFPVDHDTIPQPVVKAVRSAFQPIVYSRHAEEHARTAGLDVRYVPHGVDTAVYCPQETTAARARFGIPADAFLIGIVAANKGTPSRKALPAQFEAFARFRDKHPEAMLYLHSHLGPEMEGLDLPGTMQALGIPEDAVRVCDQYRNILGYPDPAMASLYASMDVLSSPTMGEGFGVPIIEAQACGTPVIIGDWTAMPELLGAGWAIPEDKAERVLTPMQRYQYLPHVEAIVEAYEMAYEAKGDPQVVKDAREMAIQYDADRVTREHWAPVLEEIAERIHPAEREVPPPEVLAA